MDDPNANINISMLSESDRRLKPSTSIRLELPQRDTDETDNSYHSKNEEDLNNFNFLSYEPNTARKLSNASSNSLLSAATLEYIPNSDQYFTNSGSQDTYLDSEHHHDQSAPWMEGDIPMDPSHMHGERMGMFPGHMGPLGNSIYSLDNYPLNTPRDSNENFNNSMKSRIVSTTTTVTPQSRHARRLYVGGLSTSNCNEDTIKTFLNSVIASALGDEPGTTYILSIYVNTQKCFAFIELNSIELTTACLELDGIMFQNAPLKILRANEYKPELLPPPAYPPIKLNLSGLIFGQPNTGMLNPLPPDTMSPQFVNMDPQLDHIIKFCSLNTIQRGSIVIIGYPYDDLGRRSMSNAGTATKNRGVAMAPRSIRTALRKYQSGSLLNAEFGIDLTQLRIYDIGDIQGGLSIQDAFKTLSDIIADIVNRGATPLVLGGTADIAANIATGLLNAISTHVGVINVAPVADATLLDDSRFYMTRPNFNNAKLNCEGRYVQFAAHGSCSNIDHIRMINERGGRIIWFNRDLRIRSHFSEVFQSQPQSFRPDIGQVFRQTLMQVSTDSLPGQVSPRPVCVSFSMSSLSSSHFPGHAQLRSNGLTSEDAMDIGFTIGRDKNVFVVSVNDFYVDVEEQRSSRLIVDFLYNFLLGFASRSPSSALSPRQLSGASGKLRPPPMIPSGPGRSTPTGKGSLNTSQSPSPLSQPIYNGPPYSSNPHLPPSWPDTQYAPMGNTNMSARGGNIPNYPYPAFHDRSVASSISSQESAYTISSHSTSGRGSPSSNHPHYSTSPNNMIHPSQLPQGYDHYHVGQVHRDNRPGSKGESPTSFNPDRHAYSGVPLPPPYY